MQVQLVQINEEFKCNVLLIVWQCEEVVGNLIQLVVLVVEMINNYNICLINFKKDREKVVVVRDQVIVQFYVGVIVNGCSVFDGVLVIYIDNFVIGICYIDVVIQVQFQCIQEEFNCNLVLGKSLVKCVILFVKYVGDYCQQYWVELEVVLKELFVFSGC